MDTTVTVRPARGYNSYSETGLWIQQLQSTGTYRRYHSYAPHLLRALYPLSEDAVLVADAVAIAGHSQGGHRVKEAGSKPAQTAVTWMADGMGWGMGRIMLGKYFNRAVSETAVTACQTLPPGQLDLGHGEDVT